MRCHLRLAKNSPAGQIKSNLITIHMNSVGQMVDEKPLPALTSATSLQNWVILLTFPSSFFFFYFSRKIKSDGGIVTGGGADLCIAAG